MSLVIPLKLKGRVNIWDLTNEAINRALEHAVSRINQGEIDHYTPRGLTGHLQESFYADVRGGTIRLIWPEAYAEAVDKGARRHMILPKGKKALSFPDRSGQQRATRGHLTGKSGYDGRAVVKYVLDHPGQAAQRYGMRTAKAAYGIIRDEIINEIARIEM
jgi:hypothetical protein